MKHLFWLMGIGFVIGAASTVGGQEMFPTWYLYAVVVLSVPATWIGCEQAVRTRA